MVVTLVEEAKFVFVLEIRHQKSIGPYLVDHNQASSGNISQKQRQMDGTESKHLPLATLRMLSQLEQGVCIIQLEKVAKVEERKQKRQSLPHPGHETLHCNVHLVTLPKRSQPIKTATLVVVLKDVHTAEIDDKQDMLVAEH